MCFLLRIKLLFLNGFPENFAIVQLLTLFPRQIMQVLTLKEQLDAAIEQHSWTEVLDRLTELAKKQSAIKTSDKCDRLVSLLEEAIAVSKSLPR